MATIRSRPRLDDIGEKPAARLRRPSILLLVLFSAALAACATGPDPQADQSFLTDQPCAAPCWQGLELGSSTKGATLSLLPTLPFVDAGSIVDKATTWKSDAAAREVSFGCVHPRSGNCGNAIFSGDRLRWLELSVGYALTLRMAVTKLGAPTHVDYSTGNNQGCSVTGAWPQRKIGVVLDGLADRVCQSLRMGQGMPGEVKATSVYYTDATTLESGPAACCGRLAWPGFSD
jgi:hypothetical protein